MPKIIPIKDLKNTTELSQLCHNTDDAIYITKNGYSDMVIMSAEAYEKKQFLDDASRKIAEAKLSIASGEGIDAEQSLKGMRAKYDV